MKSLLFFYFLQMFFNFFSSLYVNEEKQMSRNQKLFFEEQKQKSSLRDNITIDLNPNATAFAKLMEGHHVRNFTLTEFLAELQGMPNEK